MRKVFIEMKGRFYYARKGVEVGGKKVQFIFNRGAVRQRLVCCRCLQESARERANAPSGSVAPSCVSLCSDKTRAIDRLSRLRSTWCLRFVVEYGAGYRNVGFALTLTLAMPFYL